jgi:hypothetical protein
MTLRVLDPTSEKRAAAGNLARRLGSLAGKTVGFISNGKEGTKGYFTHLDRLLRQERAGRPLYCRRVETMACRCRRRWRLRQLLVVQFA